MSKSKKQAIDPVDLLLKNLKGEKGDKVRLSEIDKSLFDMRFKRLWGEAGADNRKKMIAFAEALPFTLGWKSIILGLDDISSSVRRQTRLSLMRLVKKITSPEQKGKHLTKSSSYAASGLALAHYRSMKSTADTESIKFSIEFLLRLKDRGPLLVWRFFSRSFTHRDMLLRVTEGLPDELKLIFIDQYNRDSLTMRKDLYSLIKPLADKIRDTRSLTLFLASLFDQGLPLDPLIKDICIRTALLESVFRNELESKGSKQEKPEKTNRGVKEKIQALKIVALLGSPADLLRCIPLLEQGVEDDIRLMVLRILERGDLKGDPAIIDAVSSLLDEKGDSLILAAFQTLISLHPKNIKETIITLLKKYPGMRQRIFRAIPGLGMAETKEILACLTPEERSQARAVVVETLSRKDNKLRALFLKAGLESSIKEIRDQSELLLKEITYSGERIYNPDGLANHGQPAIEKKTKRLGAQSYSRLKKRVFLKRLSKKISLNNIDLSGVRISDLDLSGITLSNVDFHGAILKRVDLSSAKLSSVNFSGALLEEVNLESGYLDSVKLDHASVKSISGLDATFSAVDFSGSYIYGSNFRGAKMSGSLFEHAKILESDFSLANLEEASFFGAEIENTLFLLANLQISDLSYAFTSLSDFSGSDMSMAFTSHGEFLHKSSVHNPLPSIFFEDNSFQTFQKVFDALILSTEIKRQKRIFLKHNKRRIEIAMESFRPEQADLFESIPFLVHTGENLLLYDGYRADSPKGIDGYIPSHTTLKRVRKYFPNEKLASTLREKGDIQALFTIGSVGSIAQSKDSDIDYWLCIDAGSLGEEKVGQLRIKLEAISAWALKMFRTEVHFFVMDKEKVKLNDFGSTDKESSGSAQGKLLKEELYRTIIFIAGKPPLWWLLPANINEELYLYMNELASILEEDFIDLGNVDTIPLGEYFGASIWQILKGMTSPYKSVMKMALLESYATKGENYQLLCNKLKDNYGKGSIDPRKTDPYVLLLEEILSYYQDRGDGESLARIRSSFYLKLGLPSLYDLKEMVSIDKRDLIFDYIDRWNWDEKKIRDLDQYKEWSFNRLVEQSTDINKYMIKTYRRIARSFGKVEDRMISPTDLTIFGRIIASRFTQKEGKVDGFMMVSPGEELLKRLFIRYEKKKADITWKLIQSSKISQKEKKEETLRIANRIEFLAAWMISNGLFSTETSINLYPNPSPISIQDVQDLLKGLAKFFPEECIEDIYYEDLLHDPYITRLFVILNFGRDRREKKIVEYTAIYDNSWGERFCQTFFSQTGFLSKEEVLEELETALDLTFKKDRVRFFVPQQARRHFSVALS